MPRGAPVTPSESSFWNTQPYELSDAPMCVRTTWLSSYLLARHSVSMQLASLGISSEACCTSLACRHPRAGKKGAIHHFVRAQDVTLAR